MKTCGYKTVRLASSLCEGRSDPQHSSRAWDEMIGAASAENLVPTLHDHYAALNQIAQLPSEIAKLLATLNLLNQDRNRTILAQVKRLTAALNRAGIKPIALKGLANILAGVYPSLGTRFLADVDLLVPEQQFATAVSVLHHLGYGCDEPDPVELAIGHSYPPLTRPNSIEIDLHRTTGLGICASFLTASELARHSTVHNLEGAAIRIPSPEHLVTHHIMHSQLHDSYRERVWPSLRTLYDFVLLNRHFGAALDWSSIEHRFRRHGQYATLALYLLQVEQSLGTKPPIHLQLSPAMRIRWWRRRVLHRFPLLRYADPLYYYFGTFKPRTRRVREILGQPGRWRYLLRKFCSPKFYARLRADLS